jgi:hypothetical protein
VYYNCVKFNKNQISHLGGVGNNWKNKKEEIKAIVSFGKELQKKNILYILYREL